MIVDISGLPRHLDLQSQLLGGPASGSNSSRLLTLGGDATDYFDNRRGDPPRLRPSQQLALTDLGRYDADVSPLEKNWYC
jgi:hypothetical protein